MGSVAAPFVLATLAFAVALTLWWHFVLLVLLVLGFVGVGFVLFFFRDPERTVGTGVVAPADGKVVKVEGQGETLHLAIFMNIDDVHVNRAPMDCKVAGTQRSGKGYKLAFSTVTDANVRLEWSLETSDGEVRMQQVTGWFARRIVPYAGKGAVLKKGDRIGMIRFGSRVELWLPSKRFKPAVSVGDHVKAGSSTVAERSGEVS
jgi:phosphatidylserine decarboxylase